ncbi:MAG: hypothetical protein HY716_10035 [Planctomycetes bacterium]|nr:hypothetical protein [Planctomycetota bacterium]
MFQRVGMAAAAVFLAAGVVAAGGGKIKWQEFKNEKEFNMLLAQCKHYGQAIVVFFSGEH